MKILFLDGDKLVKKIKIKNKFIFLITEDARVYHVDSTDGDMWQTKPSLLNLGAGHKKIIKKEL